MNSDTDDVEDAPSGVPHDRGGKGPPDRRPPLPEPPCARCGSPAVRRPGTRYCTPRCRHAAVRERRAAARTDLLAALDQLAEVSRRVEGALRTLGLNPRRPRARKDRHE